jgi:hypothetical protein
MAKSKSLAACSTIKGIYLNGFIVEQKELEKALKYIKRTKGLSPGRHGWGFSLHNSNTTLIPTLGTVQYMHRIIYQANTGKKLRSQDYITYKNGNKMDLRMCNLVLTSASASRRYYGRLKREKGMLDLKKKYSKSWLEAMYAKYGTWADVKRACGIKEGIQTLVKLFKPEIDIHTVSVRSSIKGIKYDNAEVIAGLKVYKVKPKFGRITVFLKGGTCNYPTLGMLGKHELLHRVVAAGKLGKPIPKGMVVHHVNEDVLDARSCNLKLMDIVAHKRYHVKKNPHYKVRGGKK